VYTQIRHMRIEAARRRKGVSKIGNDDWYDIELADGKNEFYLNDVSITAGPIRVGGLFKITIEPITE